MSAPQSQYIIGIGSQRAGSTLLHRLLNTSAEIRMHPVKELHYFDTKYRIRPAGALQKHAGKQLKRELLQCLKKPRRETLVSIETCYKLSRKTLPSYTYTDLFKRLEGKTPLIGEITPEYMLLPEPGIIELRETVGDAAIILLKRDPLQRILSAFKLFLTSASIDNQGMSDRDKDNFCLHVLEKKKGWVKVQKRFNDYDTALANYQKYFSRVLVLDYEALTGTSCQRDQLQDFLGVEFDRQAFDQCINQVVNAFNKDYRMSEEVLSAIREKFSL